MSEKITEGGWAWYTREVSLLLGRKLTTEEISLLMKEGYLKSRKVEDVVSLFNN